MSAEGGETTNDKYEVMTYSDLLDELKTTQIGSRKARQLNRALKKHGSGLNFWYRYPAAPIVTVMVLLAALTTLLLK